MKIRTAELKGAALDWAVAKCDEIDVAVSDVYPNGTRSVITYYGRNEEGFMDGRNYCPSCHWSDGGPIIDREGICTIQARPDDWFACLPCNVLDYVRDRSGESLRFAFLQADLMPGPTRLIAGLRCHVASKLGDEVEVPDELMAMAA